MERAGHPADIVGQYAPAAVPKEAEDATINSLSAVSPKKVTASWDRIPNPTARDWIGLYEYGTPDKEWENYEYTDGKSNGSRSIAIPAKTRPGNYELRLFSNNGYTRLATTMSNFFVTGDARITCSANVRPGGQITASWSNIPNPHPYDSIVFRSFGDDDHVGYHGAFTDGQASGSRSVRIPEDMLPGAYQARLFSFPERTRLAAGEGIGVQTDARLRTNDDFLVPTGELTVIWENIPDPTTSDWIGLYLAGNYNTTEYVNRQYTGGGASGSRLLRIPAGTPPGNYELRLFSNDGQNLNALLAAGEFVRIRHTARLTFTLS
jgi:hypothetical protein